jgi:hypothetical protein
MATKKTAKKASSKTLRDVKGTRAGTEDDIEAIQNGDWCDAVEVEELRAYDGDLTIEGDYSGSGARLIVHGNLTVGGTLGLDETGTLIVTGDVRCRNLHCEGDLEIQGDLTVEETIFGFYEAGITFFNGTIRAALFLQGNHSFEYDDDQLEVKTHLKFDNFRGLSQGTAEQARAALSDEAFALLGELLGLSEEDAEGEYGPLLREKGYLRR